MIYLASPYTHPDPATREHRYRMACRVLAKRLLDGVAVYSPIAHSHQAAIEMERLGHGDKGTFEFWQRHCRQMLEACEAVEVVMMAGYRESKGVNAEIDIAFDLGLPVTYLDLDGNPVSRVDHASR